MRKPVAAAAAEARRAEGGAHALKDENARLREALDIAKETIIQLREEISGICAPRGLRPPRCWRLTPGEWQILKALLARDFCSSLFLYRCYLREDENGMERSGGIKSMQVQLAHLRRKCAADGMKIDIVWGFERGYALKNRRQWLKALTAPESGQTKTETRAQPARLAARPAER